MASKSEQQPIGFITVRLHPEFGYFGGFLLVNHLARPLEFHCTLPIKPSRAQSILYGPTLDEFLCGEQIARALVLKAKSSPVVIFTDAGAVLALRNIMSQPIVMVEGKNDAGSDVNSLHHRPSGSSRSYHRFELDDCPLAVLEAYRDDAAQIQTLWQQMDSQVDLQEPFGRIADALLEAHPTTKAA